MAVLGIRQHEYGFNSGEVAVDDSHRCFIGHVDLGANSLDDRVSTDLLAIVDQQTDAPTGNRNAVRNPRVGKRLFDEFDSAGNRQQCRLGGVVHDDNVAFVKKVARALDNVDAYPIVSFYGARGADAVRTYGIPTAAELDRYHALGLRVIVGHLNVSTIYAVL